MTTVVSKITFLCNVRQCSLVHRQQVFGQTYSQYLICQMDVAGLSETSCRYTELHVITFQRNNNFSLVMLWRGAENSLINEY